MTKLEERTLKALSRRLQLKMSDSTLNTLFKHGALDMRFCEQLAIRERIEELEKRPLGRCEAMEIVAQEFCCSYEKVRKIIYNKSKNVS